MSSVREICPRLTSFLPSLPALWCVRKSNQKSNCGAISSNCQGSTKVGNQGFTFVSGLTLMRRHDLALHFAEETTWCPEVYAGNEDKEWT